MTDTVLLSITAPIAMLADLHALVCREDWPAAIVEGVDNDYLMLGVDLTPAEPTTLEVVTGEPDNVVAIVEALEPDPEPPAPPETNTPGEGDDITAVDILQYLKDHGPTTKTDLAYAFDVPEPWMLDELRGLRERGLIEGAGVKGWKAKSREIDQDAARARAAEAAY